MAVWVARKPVERFDALALCSDEAAATVLVGEHHRVYEALEEVTLSRRRFAPGRLEALMRLEVGAFPTAREPLRKPAVGVIVG